MKGNLEARKELGGGGQQFMWVHSLSGPRNEDERRRLGGGRSPGAAGPGVTRGRGIATETGLQVRAVRGITINTEQKVSSSLGAGECKL